MSALANTTNHPMGLDVDRAEGIWIHTTDGKRYMDMISGIGVSALGHGNSAINDAIKAQVESTCTSWCMASLAKVLRKEQQRG